MPVVDICVQEPEDITRMCILSLVDAYLGPDYEAVNEAMFRDIAIMEHSFKTRRFISVGRTIYDLRTKYGVQI